MEVWELVARESIRDLVARYNSNGDSARFDEVVELFTPDAVMEVDGQIYRGHAEIRTIFTGTRDDLVGRAGPVLLRHHTSTLQIDLQDEAAASSRCYFHVLMAHGLDHWGRYLDQFGLVDERWRFTNRRVVIDGAAPGGWAASRVSDGD